MLKRRLYKAIGCLLLTIFTGYYAGVTLFTHTHILNGVTIVHSHPYAKGPAGLPVKHQHSDKGYSLIQFLAKLLNSILADVASPGIVLYSFYRLIIVRNDNDKLIYPGYNTCTLRAPPSPVLH